MEKISLDNKCILVTGAAGFIGSNLVKRLFRDVKGATIVGIDNMNDYYDVALKDFRLNELDAAVPEGTVWKLGIDVCMTCACHSGVRLILLALRICQFNQSIVGHFPPKIVSVGRNACEFCSQSVVNCTQIHFCRIGTAADIDSR